MHGKNINKLVDAISNIPSMVNSKDFYDKKKKLLEDIYTEKDYEQLVKKSNSKGLCAELNRLIVPDYIEKMISMIREREDLQTYLKNKYFADIPES